MVRLEWKVMPMVTTGIFCFALGAAAGIAWMTSAGYKIPSRTEGETRVIPPRAGGGPPTGSPRNQLASLIIKLDQLSGKPSIEFDEERRANLRELLDGVEDSSQDEFAAERLFNLLEVLKEDRQVLIASGYRWPNVPFVRPGMEPEPFANPHNLEHLKSLRKKLASETPSAPME